MHLLKILGLKKNEIKTQLLMIAAGLILTLAGCERDNSDPVQVATDYSQEYHWLSIPDETETVDVFYLYPAAWRRGDNEPYICEIDNPSMLTGYLKDHPDVYQRMTAAYVIGCPVTAQIIEDNPHLKFAEGPDDTGVIISYNTQAPDVDPADNPVLSGQVGLVINPITWTRSETVANTTEGLGSIMPDPLPLVS